MRAEDRAALPDLLSRIPVTAAKSKGIVETEQDLARLISSYRTEAADSLIPMLASDNEEIVQLVQYCILELPSGSLLDRHLPALMEACRKDRGWLPSAIADIKGEASVAFLVQEFRRSPELGAQIDNAIEQRCPESPPLLIREFAAAEESETEFLDALPQLFEQLGEKAKPAVPLLLGIALQEEAPIFRRNRAIQCLGAIGPSAKDTLPELEALALREPENFEVAVQEAIIGSRTERAANELLRVALAEVRHKGELRILRNIALMEEEAAVIGDELAKLLDDPDANVRLGASRTLGFTGRLDLWPHLTRALKDSDWRVAFSACLSLGQLKAKGADVSLENLGKQHWYPRVRHAASYARSLIQGEEPSQEDARHVGQEVSSFFLYELGDLSLLPLKESQPAFPPLPEKKFILWGRWGSDDIIEGSFRSMHPELHAAISTLPESRRGGDLTALTGFLEKEGVNFVALGAGEWIGGLFAVDKEGDASLLIDENIMGLLDWNGRIVALGGLSHMGMDRGSLYEVTIKDGKAIAKLLRALPGCPLRGAILPDGRLFANCEGGAVAISPDNTITYLGSGDGRPEE